MDDDIRNRLRRAGGYSPGSTSGRIARPTQTAPVSRPDRLPVSHPAESSRPPQAAKKPKRNKNRRSSRKLLFVVLFLLVAAGSFGGFTLFNKYNKKSTAVRVEAPLIEKAPLAVEEPKPTGTVRLIAIGSSLAYESINNAAKLPDGSYDYTPMMSEFKPFFDKSDIRLCNQSTPGGGEALGISGYPSFNAPLSWSTGFASLGCNVVSLSSNHTNDKGQPAIDATAGSWANQKDILAYAGANRSAEEQAKVSYFIVKDLKFAFLSYTTATQKTDNTPFGINLYSDEVANRQIAEARQNSDLVIVSMNWGTENSGDINADQERIAQNLADNNVDVVVGVGSHIVQPAKVLSSKDGHQTLVWFSLGNFLNSELPLENLFGGMAVMDFDVASQKIVDPKFMPLYMHYEWTAAQKAAASVNARHDFKLYPLDLSEGPLAKSQNNTTVQAQTDRLTSIVTKFSPITVIKSTEF